MKVPARLRVVCPLAWYWARNFLAEGLVVAESMAMRLTSLISTRSSRPRVPRRLRASSETPSFRPSSRAIAQVVWSIRKDPGGEHCDFVPGGHALTRCGGEAFAERVGARVYAHGVAHLEVAGPLGTHGPVLGEVGEGENVAGEQRPRHVRDQSRSMG